MNDSDVLNDIEEMTLKYASLSGAINSSIEGYNLFYKNFMETYFDENGLAKNLTYEIKNEQGEVTSVREVPALLVHELPKPITIDQITVSPINEEIRNLKGLVCEVWDIVQGAGIEDEHPELKERIEKLERIKAPEPD